MRFLNDRERVLPVLCPTSGRAVHFRFKLQAFTAPIPGSSQKDIVEAFHAAKGWSRSTTQWRVERLVRDGLWVFRWQGRYKIYSVARAPVVAAPSLASEISWYSVSWAMATLAMRASAARRTSVGNRPGNRYARLRLKRNVQGRFLMLAVLAALPLAGCLSSHQENHAPSSTTTTVGDGPNVSPPDVLVFPVQIDFAAGNQSPKPAEVHLVFPKNNGYFAVNANASAIVAEARWTCEVSRRAGSASLLQPLSRIP